MYQQVRPRPPWEREAEEGRSGKGLAAHVIAERISEVSTTEHAEHRAPPSL